MTGIFILDKEFFITRKTCQGNKKKKSFSAIISREVTGEYTGEHCPFCFSVEYFRGVFIIVHKVEAGAKKSQKDFVLQTKILMFWKWRIKGGIFRFFDQLIHLSCSRESKYGLKQRLESLSAALKSNPLGTFMKF